MRDTVTREIWAADARELVAAAENGTCTFVLAGPYGLTEACLRVDAHAINQSSNSTNSAIAMMGELPSFHSSRVALVAIEGDVAGVVQAGGLLLSYSPWLPGLTQVSWIAEQAADQLVGNLPLSVSSNSWGCDSNCNRPVRNATLWVYADASFRNELGGRWYPHLLGALQALRSVFMDDHRLNVAYNVATTGDYITHTACPRAKHQHAVTVLPWVPATNFSGAMQPSAEHGSHLFVTARNITDKGCGSAPGNWASPTRVADYRVSLVNGAYKHPAGDDMANVTAHLALLMAHEVTHNWGQANHTVGVCPPMYHYIMAAGIPASRVSPCFTAQTEGRVDDAVSGSGW